MRLLLMITLLFGGSSAAGACGNPLLWAMLFAKVPEAKAVYEAELSARADGALRARDCVARPGQTYHAWSKKWLVDVARDMQPAVRNADNQGAPERPVPCRGCADDCRLRQVCQGSPWRLTREQQDRYLGRK